jgi:hypothetical protein
MHEFDQYKAEEAKPDAKATINSYRSFGYNLSTATADIIDNSISAGCKKIDIKFTWDGERSVISIEDDGGGMDLREIISAMTPGSKNPDDPRARQDLGRFGMGLKTASFSQCKRLTVISKKDKTLGYRCWDIDYVNSINEWALLKRVSDVKYIEKLQDVKSGTIIVWEVLDRIVGEADRDNETVKAAFYHELSIVSSHLSLVFHKYLEQKKITIKLNGKDIEPWNPFLLGLDPKPEMGPLEYISKNVTARYYILPHMSSISAEAYENSGGPAGWFNQQGFYIYRNDRLIVAADWLGLERKRDFNKLARVEVNFLNDNDFNWHLDIKKSVALPPLGIRRDLARVAHEASLKSVKIYNWRSDNEVQSIIGDTKVVRIWYDETNRDGVKKYKINRSHPLVRELLAGDSDKKIAGKALKVLEEHIPLDLILYNQNEDPKFHEAEKPNEVPPEHTIQLARELYLMNVEQGVNPDLARQHIMSSIPFNRYSIIIDYLK